MNDCILVFGMPRSGTTWVGKLFDSHPDTLYRHESGSVRRLSLPLFPETETAPDVIERIVQILRRSALRDFYDNDVQDPPATSEAVS